MSEQPMVPDHWVDSCFLSVVFLSYHWFHIPFVGVVILFNMTSMNSQYYIAPNPLTHWKRAMHTCSSELDCMTTASTNSAKIVLTFNCIIFTYNVCIGSGDGLASNRQKSFTSINVYPVHCHIYATQSLELGKLPCRLLATLSFTN